MACVFLWYSVWVLGLIGLFRVDSDVPYVILVRRGSSQDVPVPQDKDHFLCVFHFEDDWELAMIDPSSFSVYPWLSGRKPGVS
jgi:hypothetical protein